ncbi:MAG TPA: polyketide synthase dehydratase domain-containing protein, partial [Polyangiales bacterium]|nr:polyketide synthase dehydratase domain-containing protein [Polyangiales bacterium]
MGHVRLPAAAGGGKGFLLHPALLDACFQVIGAALERVDGVGDPTGYLPAGVSNYRVLRSGVEEVWCHVTVARPSAAGSLTCDLVLLTADGNPVAEVTGLELRRLTSAGVQRSRATRRDPADWAFETQWEIAQDDAQGAAAVTGRWLVLGEAGGLGASVARDLRAAGADAKLVTSAASFGATDVGWKLDPRDRAQAQRLIAEASNGAQLAGVVCLWPLEAVLTKNSGPRLIAKDCDATTAPVLALAQALASSSARLWLVTRGAQPVLQSVPDPVQAAAWGLGGVVASELPSLRTIRVDMDPVASATEAAALARVLRSQDSEARVALRGNARLVARLAPAEVQPSREDPLLRLDITERGSLSNLALTPYELPPPGPGEVEIRVHATGLNFRDVLNALGMYPGDPGPLGNECAGVVTAVGPGVSGLAVGAEVISMPARAFATRVIAPAILTVPKPRSLTFAEAATIPVTFLTADYALRHLGGMKRGDRVLIHSVAGGVGMAATQLARRAGAEIFGTAGSPAKRALALSLGVHHVSDSRSVSFAADVMRDSGGKGVDIVLNSLAGDFIPASLGTLASGGRFV